MRAAQVHPGGGDGEEEAGEESKSAASPTGSPTASPVAGSPSQPAGVDDGEESDQYEEGSDSDDSVGVDVGAVVLSKEAEDKKRRKMLRRQQLESLQSKGKKNFVQARQELKDKIIKEVMEQVLPDIGLYDVSAPQVTNTKKWYDPFVRLGKIFGLVPLSPHEGVLCGNENFLERALEKVHQGKKSNRALLCTYDDGGMTPLSLAAKTNQVAMVQQIVARHVDVDVPDLYTGRTPLYYAARLANYTMVKILCSNGGANPAFGDYKSVTPLMMAAYTNDYRSLELMLNPRMLKGKHFVEVDQVDDNGWTALHYAVLGCANKTCRVLLKNGADRRIKDLTKKTPQNLARFLDEKDPDGPGKWGLVMVEIEDSKAKMV